MLTVAMQQMQQPQQFAWWVSAEH